MSNFMNLNKSKKPMGCLTSVRFPRRQLEIVIQCFEEVKPQIQRGPLWGKKPVGFF